MYKVFFYDNARGKVPIADYLNELKRRSVTSKSSKADLYAIIAYFDVLAEKGTLLGEPAAPHLDGCIWELRPLKNRIFYAFVKDDTIILLHHFIKRSEQTSQQEVRQAKRNLNNLIKRNVI